MTIRAYLNVKNNNIYNTLTSYKNVNGERNHGALTRKQPVYKIKYVLT